MTDDNDFKLKKYIVNENNLLKEQNNILLEEVKILKEKLKKYNCPNHSKVYYEKIKKKLLNKTVNIEKTKIKNLKVYCVIIMENKEAS